ncbi:MAG: phosphatase PAP2 family protein [Steroidobacteraceae bacterium]|jgi:undecaprenyl-diphosphatase|nr:phosphatase PAP2 family protein [Steroidobacteraceae bacterium]
MSAPAGWFLRADLAERRLCLVATAVARRRAFRRLFQVASRLGDGAAWYALMAAMPLLLGRAGWAAALQMLGTGGVGLGIYKLLKRRLVRERPYVGLAGIPCAMAPLDRYSFPSGHTLHAVCFTLLALHHVPALAPGLVPFAVLVALSRVVLGLHYPSDVLAGAALGAGLALASLEMLA